MRSPNCNKPLGLYLHGHQGGGDAYHEAMPDASVRPGFALASWLPSGRPGWPLLALLVLLLQACSTTPRSGSATSGGAAGEPAARAEATLSVERQWLQSWFKGTPVEIDQRGDGPLSIDIPREFCFDAGRSNVKPALAAVLDKVAESLRRTPRARLQAVAAPGDSAAPSALAVQRATRVRAHLLSRGAQASQLSAPTSTDAAAVQLRMTLAPA